MFKGDGQLCGTFSSRSEHQVWSEYAMSDLDILFPQQISGPVYPLQSEDFASLGLYTVNKQVQQLQNHNDLAPDIRPNPLCVQDNMINKKSILRG